MVRIGLQWMSLNSVGVDYLLSGLVIISMVGCHSPKEIVRLRQLRIRSSECLGRRIQPQQKKKSTKSLLLKRERFSHYEENIFTVFSMAIEH